MANNWFEVLLRIPVIFVLDFSLSFIYDHLSLPWYISLVIQGFCIIACVLVLVSSYHQLQLVYYFGVFIFHLFGILYLNIWKSPELLDRHYLSKRKFPYFLLKPVVIGWIGYLITIVIYAFAFRSIKPVLMMLSLTPVFLKQVKGTHGDPTFIQSVAFCVALFLSLKTAYSLCVQFSEVIKYQIRVISFRYRMYGALVLFVLHWRRLKLSTVLSLYWLIFWTYQMLVFSVFVEQNFQSVFMLASAAYSCNSFIKISSLCYVIQYTVKVLLTIIHELVKDDHTVIDDGQHRPSGLRESVGFLVLSLYTNLTSINSSKRIVLFELMLLLLVSALLRSIFEVVEPYLLSLNNAIVYSWKRHVQIISICVLLMGMAAYMGFHLYRLREKIPYTIPNIITVAQILAGLLLYLIYKYDSSMGGTWEDLDDYVYYIKGTCRTFEFLLILIVLGYRVLDTSSKWTVFQVVMVVLHLYVNVYLSLKDGVRSVKLWRLTKQKLNILPEATEERLAENSDVCPICLDELRAAKITPCNHLFHTLCLKKWLNLRNECPMCHAAILSAA